jgi:hypothetical protein
MFGIYLSVLTRGTAHLLSIRRRNFCVSWSNSHSSNERDSQIHCRDCKLGFEISENLIIATKIIYSTLQPMLIMPEQMIVDW